MLVVGLLIPVAGLACSVPPAESDSTNMVVTTGPTSLGTTSSTASDSLVQVQLDLLRAIASRTPFTVYHLSTGYRDASIAEVVGYEDSNGEVYEVSVTYRSADQQNLLVVYLTEYDPVATPRLKKPFADWTFVREEGSVGPGDSIYRSGTGILYYVADKGSTELNLAGLTTAGYMNEEQLIEVASLLDPVR